MQRYKMVCLDIDGTLLNSGHEITQTTKEVIQQIANVKKIPVILVSARMPRGILFLQQELNITEPIICYSGALIWDDHNILSSIYMPASLVKNIYALAKDANIHLSLYRDDEWYVECMDEWAKQEAAITKNTPSLVNFNDLLDEWEREGTGPNKILCMATPESLQLFQSTIDNLYSDALNIYLSKTTYLEINSNKATKTAAIEFLLQKYGLHKDEIIAIGDNYNDINMLEFAGMGIAMANAPDDVKQHAKYITASNDEEGVSKALKKYILFD